MARKRSLLERMSANPRDDWSMDDVARLCEREGLEVRSPKRGSHHVIVSPYLRDVLTVPSNRPIKPIYIKYLVSYVRAHKEGSEARRGEGNG